MLPRLGGQRLTSCKITFKNNYCMLLDSQPHTAIFCRTGTPYVEASMWAIYWEDATRELQAPGQEYVVPAPENQVGLADGTFGLRSRLIGQKRSG
jgi:hypothetical protein